MGFNSGFKGLMCPCVCVCVCVFVCVYTYTHTRTHAEDKRLFMKDL